MKRVGILGGTFDPIHMGHLIMAQTVQQDMTLDKVIFVPNGVPPHKSSKKICPAGHRFQMVKKAIQGNPELDISDIELKRKGKSYTVDTLKYFREKFSPKTKLYFIIGEDMLPGLRTWKNIHELLKYTTFVVVNRSKSSKKKNLIKCRTVFIPSINISSSDIRRRIKSRKSIKYLVSDGVERYIRKHKLYLS